MYKLLPIFRKISYLFLFLIFLASCVPQRKFVYVQSKGKKNIHEYSNEYKKNIKIEPFDLLQITINSIDQSGFNFLNQSSVTNGSATESGLALVSYTVDDAGYITLPLIGKLKLSGLTLDQATEVIQDAAKSVLNTPIASIRFVNSNVTILGEVLHPGTFIYTKEQLTIFRAIGLAGDITEYGNRRKVVLMREHGSEIDKITLNLTSDSIFESEYFYLRPNDVIYVQPLKIRRWGMKEFPFSLIVSSITSAFLIYFYVKQ